MPTTSAPCASTPSTYSGSTGMGRPTMKKPTKTASARGNICMKTGRAVPPAAGSTAAVDAFDMRIP